MDKIILTIHDLKVLDDMNSHWTKYSFDIEEWAISLHSYLHYEWQVKDFVEYEYEVWLMLTNPNHRGWITQQITQNQWKKIKKKFGLL